MGRTATVTIWEIILSPDEGRKCRVEYEKRQIKAIKVRDCAREEYCRATFRDQMDSLFVWM